MHNQFLIAVDSGKSHTKACMTEDGEYVKVKFQTKMEEVQDIGIEVTPNSFIIEYEGKNFLVGDMLDESKLDFRLTKASETHRICIYLAIAQLLSKSKQSIALANIALAVNIPLSIYKNELQKTAFSDFIMRNGDIIAISYNNKPFAFRISTLLLLPEGLGPIYSEIHQYRDKRLLIVDIGSLNVNFQEFNNLIPVYEKMITSDHGVATLRGKIADQLTTRYGVSISDSDVEAVYRDKYLYLNGEKQSESKEIVEKLTLNHVKEILNFARSRKLSFANTELVCVGGGSLLLKDYILTEYPAAFIPSDPQWANALSFLVILEAKQRGKTA
ncbi:ParM/StbA family protein [Paenibacillus glycinis]|uniref:Actin-like protein N-terminal domain-containing protein n=1 Tax=Paenibacillus glycinis TaxID=2697035 RepID=A0ABW9XSI0_9BACL|nr:ParM/StbA family protein [Paenibacillus glycinis]NBD25627.1 hypothetical protein [Paenibacillus glycinis]